MKISLVTVNNGTFKIENEKDQSQLQSMIVAFHEKCKNLWNAEDVEKVIVQIVDENFNVVAGKSETIIHPVIQPVE